MTGWGLLAFYQGDGEVALSRLTEAQRLWQASDDPFGGMIARSIAGATLVGLGRYDSAVALIEDEATRRWKREAGAVSGCDLLQLGLVAFARGDLARASELCDASLAHYEARGSRYLAIDSLRYLALIALLTGNRDAAAERLAEVLVRLRERNSPAAYAEGLATTAIYAAATDQLQTAARLFAAAAALRATAGRPFGLPERDVYEQRRSDLHARLGEPAWRALEGEGAALPVEQALGLAAAALLSPVATDAIPDEPENDPASPLTGREHEVLRLLAEGRSNPEIGAALFIGRGTVRTHVSAILAKLDARTRTEAAHIAFQRGWV
jgi:ATP/maltotriose-dependent transcriptional regulator MalT